MKVGMLAACAVAMIGASGARAADLAPAGGAIDGLFHSGPAIHDGVDRSGFRLTHMLRLRIDGITDNLRDVVDGVSPLRQQMIDPTRRRGFSSVLDLFPARDSGFHLTAGMRRSPKRARWSPGAASAYTFFMPKLSSPQLVKSNVTRSSPMAMIGWSGQIGRTALLSLSGGAIKESGKALRMNPAMIARQQATSAGWSRIGQIAQASFSIAF